MTSFVTEYRHCTSEHTAPFTIEVDYSDEKEIEDHLSELLYSYREPFANHKPQGDTDAEYLHLQKMSEDALSMLQSIFPNRRETAPEALKDFSTDDAFDRVLDGLKRLATNLTWPAGAEGGRWTSSADNVDQCQEKSALFMKDGLWPLVNVVRYRAAYSCSRILPLF